MRPSAPLRPIPTRTITLPLSSTDGYQNRVVSYVIGQQIIPPTATHIPATEYQTYRSWHMLNIVKLYKRPPTMELTFLIKLRNNEMRIIPASIARILWPNDVITFLFTLCGP